MVVARMLQARLGRGMRQHQSIAFAAPGPMPRVAGRLELVMPHQSPSFAEGELVMQGFQQVFLEMSRRVWVQSPVE